MSETQESKPRSRYWRSLNEIKQTPEFEEFMHREFPVGASEFPDGVSRRRWLKLMGASIALGTVSATGCRYPVEAIAPFVIRPEGREPGEPHYTATNIEWAGRVYNLLMTGVDGRPIKVEGNPEHPGSKGGTDSYIQGSILSLYDPDRVDGVISRNEDRIKSEETWESFVADGFGTVRSSLEGDSGNGFGVLISPSQSPTVVRLLAEMQQKYSGMVVGRYDSILGSAMDSATKASLGSVRKQVLSVANAKVICSIDADIVGTDQAFVANAAGFSAGRDPKSDSMNRLYSIESGFTNTGMAADTRYAIQPSQMPAFLALLEKEIDGLLGGGSHDHGSEDAEVGFDELPGAERIERILDVLAHDLVDSQGKSLVVVGEHLGADALSAGIRINKKLGNLNKTVKYIEAVDSELATVSLTEFVSQLNGGQIKNVVVLADNPVYTAPGDVDLAAALAKAERSAYIGLYDDETGYACQWVLPLAHPFESWSDCRGDDGFYGVTQPQILPLLGGKTAAEYLAWFLGEDEVNLEEMVRKTANDIAGEGLSNRQWRKLLHDGFAADKYDEKGFESLLKLNAEYVDVSYSGGEASSDSAKLVPPTEYMKDGFVEVVMVPADGVYDGRFANNGWLQELPQSVTKLTWDNAAIISPQTAEKIGVSQNKMIALGEGDGALELPVYEMPGQAPGVVTVALGYGRRRAGSVGGSEDLEGGLVGFDVASLRTTESPRVAYDVPARPRATEYELATTQDHFAIDELGMVETAERSERLIRELTLEKLLDSPDHVGHMGIHFPAGKSGKPESLWTEPMDEFKGGEHNRPQWGMSIDLNKCVGCNACVVACQSENNVPIVGKEQVSMGREMHWIRVDRYFSGDPTNEEATPEIVQQPVACQHCETAPCEQVCPVAATVHTEEGINAMAYNRCIGTRYCANNCPYKVRRFNYFNFNEDVGTGYGVESFPSAVDNANKKLAQLVLNPEVSVRGRGVMEKCTYCIQRVERAKIDVRKEGGRGGQDIKDGSLKTACQQACACKAIEFGNLADAESAVSKRREDVRSYLMLEQLNVKPRTSYMARVRNTHRRLFTRSQLDQLHEELHHGAAHGEDPHGESGHTDGDAHESKNDEKAARMSLPNLGDATRVGLS